MVNFAIVLPNKAVLISLAESTANHEVPKVQSTTPRPKERTRTSVNDASQW